MKARVVVLKEYRKPFVIEEYDVPEPASGAVLLRMAQAGICGSDLHSWRGDRDPQFHAIPPAGQVMGHEGYGVIDKLGPGVTTDWAGRQVAVGDRVVHWSGTACFRCRQCLREARICAPVRPRSTRPRPVSGRTSPGPMRLLLRLSASALLSRAAGASGWGPVVGELRHGHVRGGAGPGQLPAG
jgi:Zn-dependent alcohol dehydrogenase